MRVLVACEFSGIVRDAFAKRGHDAWSCDILPTEAPGNHIQDDVLKHLDDGWDLMVAHPPCTYLCRQSWRWVEQKMLYHEYRKARDFFRDIAQAFVPRICIENPIPHSQATSEIGRYSQIIQPYQFGHDYSKKTCLWLKNLPALKPTNLVELTYYITPNGKKYTRGWYFTPRNGKDRSRTFQGIANAMAEQWGTPV